jgi:hypothetical protein
VDVIRSRYMNAWLWRRRFERAVIRGLRRTMRSTTGT